MKISGEGNSPPESGSVLVGIVQGADAEPLFQILQSNILNAADDCPGVQIPQGGGNVRRAQGDFIGCVLINIKAVVAEHTVHTLQGEPDASGKGAGGNADGKAFLGAGQLPGELGVLQSKMLVRNKKSAAVPYGAAVLQQLEPEQEFLPPPAASGDELAEIPLKYLCGGEGRQLCLTPCSGGCPGERPGALPSGAPGFR